MTLNSLTNSMRFLVLLFVVATFSDAGYNDRVLLRDVEVITLYDNQMTSGRRNSPIPQLKCVGGSAGCHSHKPPVVQCYNRGFDGTDVQWECKADLDARVKFGRIEVLCEGFDYPDDPYILKGSCGLEYHLENSGKGFAEGKTYGTKSAEGSSWAGPIVFILVIIVIWFVYTSCGSGTAGRTPGGPGGHGGGGGGPDYPHNPDSRGPPPPYGWNPGSDSSSYSSKPSTSSGAAGSSGPGFWTGAGVGGMMGYLFGNANRPYAGGHQRPYGGGGYGGFGSNQPSTSWGGGGGSSGSSGATASSSGFGGTRRR